MAQLLVELFVRLNTPAEMPTPPKAGRNAVRDATACSALRFLHALLPTDG
jgi:hypothetical protein